MNKCVFIGNLTRDPELRETQSGTAVCKFTIAVGRKKVVEGQPSADFIDVVAWRTLGENCDKYLKKGNKIAVCGSLQTRTYTNDEGKNVKVSEVIAEEVEFLTAKQNNEQSGTLNEVSADDAIPF